MDTAMEINPTLTKEAPVEEISFGSVLRERNFRLLWTGETISLLGDQFFMIALPWLVLQLTGSALAMGTVLAIAGVPRALFMLVGGALTDRFSPRTLMFASNAIRFLFVGALAGLVITGNVNMLVIYGMSLVFGIADAFFYPAQSSIVPQMVKPEALHVANSLVQGAMQVSIFLGPALAGVVIAIMGGGQAQIDGQAVPDMRGIGVALALDAASFLGSLITLALMRMPASAAEKQTPGEEAGMFSAIKECIVYVWERPVLRIWFIVVAAINLTVTGPFAVGIPLIAHDRFIEGAVAFGIITSAYGGGSFLGTILSGILPRPRPSQMGMLFMGLMSLLGLGVVGLGLTYSTFVAAGISLAIGILDGYVIIQCITWLQTKTPPALLGRVMSLLMFAAIGLSPVSTALAGAALTINVTAVFVVCGLAMAALCLGSILSKDMRDMGNI